MGTRIAFLLAGASHNDVTVFLDSVSPCDIVFKRGLNIDRDDDTSLNGGGWY